MSETQIAEALDVSTRTVARDWLRARAYLFTMLADSNRADQTGE
jgi:DNA-directed RNA polymerase specialized sigma24 family protein